MADYRQRSITIFDVAKASGVSSSTVSRVLSGFAFVKASTRQKVLDTANDLGYVANLPARSLAGGKSNTIGMLVPSLDNGYINVVSKAIDEALNQAGFDLVVYTTHHKKGKEAQYASTLAGGLSDGLLLMIPSDYEDQRTNYLEGLRLRQFPYVLIDQIDQSNQSTTIDSTNYQGALEAMNYLIGLGHQRIGLITGVMAINSARERLRGYKTALKKAGITVDEKLIVQGDFNSSAGYTATRKLLELSPRPTAIFASNDLSAFGAMDAVRQAGLEIPKDISIIGFDDIPQAATSYPKLSTIRQPLDDMGRLAVKLLLEQVKNPSVKPRQVTLETSLIIRDSCQTPS